MTDRAGPRWAVVGAVVASTFFVGIGGGVVFPILPNLGAVLGISPFLVGLILSANRFTRILANAPAGSLVDRLGTRTPFVVGLFVEGVATVGYVTAVDAGFPEAWFLGARVLWGIGSALVFATAYTIAADVSERQSRGAKMGVIRGGITLGFPAGLVLGGVVSDVYGVSTAFLLAAGVALLASLVAYRLVPETHVETERPAVRPWEVDVARPTLTVGLVNFGLFFTYLGALFATLVLLAVAGSLEVLVVACLLIGAGQGGTSGPLMALLADLSPSERMGRAMGTNNVLGDLGGGLGPLVSLPLVDSVGFRFLYVICAVIPVLAGVLLLWSVNSGVGRPDPHVSGSVDD